jgi:Protein of unknown function (DUF3078)
MRKVILLFSGVLLAAVTFGQETEKTTSKGKWERGLSFGLHVGQGGSRNWAIGAEKFSLWTAASLNIYANKTSSGGFYWDNNGQFNYGFLNSHSGGFRKTDDKIDVTTKLGIKPGTTKLGIAFMANLRTQFYDGYNYNYLNQDLKRRISGFMAPGYVHFGFGVDLKPASWFSVFISPLAGKFTVVTNKPYSYSFQGGQIPEEFQTEGFGEYERPLAINYGVDPEKELRKEYGPYLVANFQKEIMKNVSWRSKLELFSGFSKETTFFGPNYSSRGEEDAKPGNVDVYWSNSVIMKVNKFLNVSYDFDLINDDNVRMFGPTGDVAATQLRSLLGVGVGVIAKF